MQGITQLGQHHLLHAGHNTGLHTNVTIGQNGVYHLRREMEILLMNGTFIIYLKGTVIILAGIEAFLACTLAGNIAGNTHHSTLQTLHQKRSSRVFQIPETVIQPLVHGPFIVCQRGAEGIEKHRRLLTQKLLSAYNVILEPARSLIHGDGEMRSDNEHLPAHIAYLHTCLIRMEKICLSGITRQNLRQGNLFCSNHIALLCPRSLLLQLQIQCQEIVAVLLEGRQFFQRQHQLTGLQGSHLRGKSTGSHHITALLAKLPRAVKLVQIREEVFIAQANTQPLAIGRQPGIDKGSILLHLADFIVKRRYGTVAVNHPLNAEDTIVGEFAVVAAVALAGHLAAIGQCHFLVVALVNPLPNTATDNGIAGINRIPIILQITHGIAKNVGILGDVPRLHQLAAGYLAGPVHTRVLVGA